MRTRMTERERQLKWAVGAPLDEVNSLVRELKMVIAGRKPANKPVRTTRKAHSEPAAENVT